MHNRTRASRAAQAQEPLPTRVAQAVKMRTYRETAMRVLLRSDFAAEDKLLRSNPDFATLWNARRRYILADSTEPAVLLSRELGLTKEQIATRNSKSYGAWYHRRWALEHLGAKSEEFMQELALCDQLLERDARNFHCWAHRNWVVEQLADSQDELATSRRLIEKNFSNYSAWHLRARTLQGREIDFATEFDLTANAFYTEPADQSAWMYFRWLVARAPVDIVRAQVQVVEDLIKEEGDCKWPLLALLQLNTALESDSQVLLGIVTRLSQVDGNHNAYYRHLHGMIERKVVGLRSALFV